MIALVLIPLILSQTPPPAQPTSATPAPDAAPAPSSADERAAAAAEKAAEAAQKAAEAAALVVTQLRPATPPTCVPPPAPPPPPPPLYDYSLGVSLISLTGNTESVTGSVNGAGDYRLGQWVLSGKLSGTYGQSRSTPGTPSAVLAEQGVVQARVDRKFTDLVAAFALAGIGTDHVKSVEYDLYGEVGLSLFWWDLKSSDDSVTYFRTDVGLRVDQQSRYQYFPTPEAAPSLTLVGPHVGLEFRKGLTAALLFTEIDDIAENVDGPSRTVLASVTKLSVRVVGSLAVGGSFTLNYDSSPAPGKLPTDTALALTLDYRS